MALQDFQFPEEDFTLINNIHISPKHGIFINSSAIHYFQQYLHNSGHFHSRLCNKFNHFSISTTQTSSSSDGIIAFVIETSTFYWRITAFSCISWRITAISWRKANIIHNFITFFSIFITPQCQITSILSCLIKSNHRNTPEQFRPNMKDFGFGPSFYDLIRPPARPQ